MKKWYLWAIALTMIISSAEAQSSLHLSKQEFKDQFLSSINSVRAKGCNCGTTYMRPAAPITWSDVLASAASEHAMDMYKNDYFDHTSIDGRSLQDRLFSAGYTYNGFQSYTIGENIAAGQHSIAEVTAGWFKSVGHCKNLMNPDFKEIGIFEYHYYWVEDFGGRIPLEKGKRYSGRWVVKQAD